MPVACSKLRWSTTLGLVCAAVLAACADKGTPPPSTETNPSLTSGSGAAQPMAGQGAAGSVAPPPPSPPSNAVTPPSQNPVAMPPMSQGGSGAMMPNATAGSSGMGPAGGTGGAGGAMPMPTPIGMPIERGNDPTEASASRAGPYNVESYTSGFRAPQSYGGGTIHYPTDAEPPLGIVVVCPGFTAPQLLIQSWGPFLASHGIVTMTIDTITPLDPVDARAVALMDALGGVQAENARAGSPLNGQLDIMRAGVMGWSMGGGGTWINAATHPELKTAIALAGHILTSPLNDLTEITVPTLMLAGALDTAILGGGMSQPVYMSIPESTPKMLYEVGVGDHNIGNNPSNHSGAIGRYGLAWQKVFLENDQRYRKFLLQEGPGASDFRSNVK
jgi:dienelactone hydrolase